MPKLKGKRKGGITMPKFSGSVDLLGITVLNVPGAKKTTVTGINNYGQVVGHYKDANDKRHGFLYKEHSYSNPIDFPGVDETYILGVNNYNQLVGRQHNDGFLYSKGTFSPPLNFPQSELTTPADINDYGEIVGSFQDSNGKNHGFLYNAGEYYLLEGPGRRESFASATNDSGQIAGGFADRSGTFGFVYLESAGVYSETLQYPGATVTYPHGINNRGEIVGIFSDKEGNDQPFIYFAASCHQIKIPGAKSASALDINDHGQVIGHFIDDKGMHAYLGVVLT